MQWVELMFSRLTAAVCNFGFSRPKKPLEQDAFMLHPFPNLNGSSAVPDEPPGDTLIKVLESLPAGIVERV